MDSSLDLSVITFYPTVIKPSFSASQMLIAVLYIALVKVTGTFQKSTEIMKASNELIKLPQLSATMREMSAEMMKVSPQSPC
jgi:predicted benzoate:H+ symporter BenE